MEKTAIGFSEKGVATLLDALTQFGIDGLSTLPQLWFNDINYFQPDGSTRVEIRREWTKSGSPAVIEFDADDFEYKLSANA